MILRSSVLRLVVFVLTLCILPIAAAAQQVDCSEAYNGKPTQCTPIPCASRYQEFLGVWTGPFHAYVKELSKDGQSVFRPYQNTTTYKPSDCLQNPALNEVFIIGHMTDVYPAFSGLPARTEHSLLITGTANGSPCLRIVDNRKTSSNYRLVYRNQAASTAVWSLNLPSHEGSPEMEFSTIDGPDLTVPSGNRRNVIVTLRVGPGTQPYFDQVIAYGYHVRQPQ